jgi:hypothetical protein
MKEVKKRRKGFTRISAKHQATRVFVSPDALVIATADELGADRVLTGDESWTRISRRVTLVQVG